MSIFTNTLPSLLPNRAADILGTPVRNDAAVVDRRSASRYHRFLGTRGVHHGQGGRRSRRQSLRAMPATSSCQCERGFAPSSAVPVSKPVSPAAVGELPGPMWAALAIERALTA